MPHAQPKKEEMLPPVRVEEKHCNYECIVAMVLPILCKRYGCLVRALCVDAPRKPASPHGEPDNWYRMMSSRLSHSVSKTSVQLLDLEALAVAAAA
jgi:hypothetical protein